MKNKFLYLILITAVTNITLNSCKRKGCTDSNASNYDEKAKKDDGSCEYNTVGEYDRTKMLTNLADNYIIPAYTNYETTVIELENKSTAFTGAPSIATLTEIRAAWKSACISWQGVSFIDFGPASDISLKAQTNIYPIDTVLVNSNIASGSYNLQLPNNFDAKGLQALDYLLYGTGNNAQEVVDYFINTSEAQNYLTAITSELKTNASTVLNNWNNSYSQSFKSNSNDNSQGSSVSILVNALSQHYESYIRKGKVGLPAGVFNGFSQQPMPGHVEALYSSNSVEYAIAVMDAFRKFVKGNNYNDNTEGQGLDDYINFVAAKDASGNALETTIENQITTIITALNTHANPLSDEVVNNSSQVMVTYQEMQKLVPLIKVDLTSALGVLITYQDNDGD
ncbi:MAG: imelysin family protein [Flavobacteriales bacterium]|jgi:predicted lipoprotein|nr:imelysin family protein [Flavobacteriales bacterium]